MVGTFFGGASALAQTTRYVLKDNPGALAPYTNWAMASASVRPAVLVAAAGDAVLVSNGLYQEELTLNVTNAITVRSVHGAGVTAIDHMGYAGRVVSVLAAGASVEGFTLLGGATENGGGVYCAGGARIVDSTILSNRGNYGCGVYLAPGGVMSNCTVAGNYAYLGTLYGGGVYCVSGVVANCRIERNLAHYGGGVYCLGGEVRDTFLANNIAYWPGGDIGERGGGLYIQGTGIVDRCVIVSNRANSFNGWGGGVFFQGGGLLRNSLVASNASAYGGGVYCSTGGVIESCTLSLNAAVSWGSGGGVHFQNGGRLLNSIVHGNTGSSTPDISTYGAGMTYEHSCSSVLLPGDGNKAEDPLFVEPAGRNFRLGPGSPCKDAGTNQAWMAGARDLDGRARVLGGCVDMGAYETPFSVDFSAAPQAGLAPLASVFTASAEGDASQIVFQWDFNNDGSWDAEGAGLNVVTSLYSTAGRYAVRLDASNAAGAVASLVKEGYIHAAATDLYVARGGAHTPPFTNWAQAATNIQAAVAEAEAGSVIHVTNGTYVLSSTLVIGKAMEVAGVGAAETIVDGSNAVRCFHLTDPGVVLRNLTIQRGYDWTGSGAGILASSGCHVVSCVIRSNWAGWNGGGIYTGGGIISNCTVSFNGNRNQGIGLYSLGALITDSRIEGNRASGADGYYGGGLYGVGGAVRRCEFIRNSSYHRGGGVYAAGGLVIEDCVFSSNFIAVNYGGTVALLGGSVMRDSTVAFGSSGGDASGVYIEGSAMERCIVRDSLNGNAVLLASGTLERSQIIRNQGGGVGLSANTVLRGCLVANNANGGVSGANGASLESCTIAANRGAYWGGLYVPMNATARVENCVVHGNGGAVLSNYRDDGVIVFSNSCTHPLPPGEGNLDADPQYVDANSDFRLLPGSPCRDAGHFEGWMTGAQDLDGQDRLHGGAVDMGAYEQAEAGLAVNFIAAPPLEAPGPRDVVFTSFAGGTNTQGLFYSWDFDGDGTADLEGFGLAVVTQQFAGFGWHDVALSISNEASEVAIHSKPGYIGVGPSNIHVAAAGAHSWPYADWANAATSLQAAVDAGLAGSRILVSNGTYALASPVVVSNGVTICAFNGRGSVAVDGGNAVRCFELRHEEARLEGLIVRNGQSAQNGGGVYFHGAGTVSNCELRGCSAVSGGGAYFYHGGTVRDSLIQGNAAEMGGGLSADTRGFVANCQIVSNQATSGDGGGARATLQTVIRDSVLAGNTCQGGMGGGLSCDGAGTIENCVILSNRCGGFYQGGGVHLTGGARLLRSTVAFNRAAPGSGGGLYLNYGALAENCVIHNNDATSEGGGVSGHDGVILRNCTLTGNTASNYGGGAYFSGGAIALANSISYFNLAGIAGHNYQVGGGTMSCTYSCITPDPGGAGNTALDPLFLDAAGHDFRLAEGSPCVSAGTDLQAPAEDRDGVPRPLDGNHTGFPGYDIGAYEFVSAVADTDDDGLADAQEVYVYGCHPIDPDTDRDDQTDGDEVIAGASPTDAQSFFAVHELESAAASTGMVLSWAGVGGRLYTVQSAEGLFSAWSDLPGCIDLPGVDGTMSCTNSAPAASELFYAIRVRLAD